MPHLILNYVMCRNMLTIFLFTYVTTSITRLEFIQFKYLEQLPRKAKVALRVQVNKLAYRCSNAFPLENKISKFEFALQVAIQTIVAYETKKLDDKGQSSETVIQTARKKCEAYRVCLTGPTVTQEKLYAVPLHDDDEVFSMYRKR